MSPEFDDPQPDVDFSQDLMITWSRGYGKSLASAFKTVAETMQEQTRVYDRLSKSITSAWIEAYDRERALKRDINDKNYTKLTTPDWRKRR